MKTVVVHSVSVTYVWNLCTFHFCLLRFDSEQGYNYRSCNRSRIIILAMFFMDLFTAAMYLTVYLNEYSRHSDR